MRWSEGKRDYEWRAVSSNERRRREDRGLAWVGSGIKEESSREQRQRQRREGRGRRDEEQENTQVLQIPCLALSLFSIPFSWLEPDPGRHTHTTSSHHFELEDPAVDLPIPPPLFGRCENDPPPSPNHFALASSTLARTLAGSTSSIPARARSKERSGKRQEREEERQVVSFSLQDREERGGRGRTTHPAQA